ncbi:MAG: TIGR04438 family Trp-rich protein [Pseudomonadota bacterium]|nr:TIGR04438 family Trp-rich protein [Pseudomonadota bacterium]
MYLLGLGIILLLMKWLEFGPVAAWSWWLVLSPFAGAVVWWAWADASGYTKRKAIERENERKMARINRQREATGQKPRSGGSRRR